MDVTILLSNHGVDNCVTWQQLVNFRATISILSLYEGCDLWGYFMLLNQITKWYFSCLDSWSTVYPLYYTCPHKQHPLHLPLCLLRQHPPPPYVSNGMQAKGMGAVPSLAMWWSITRPQILIPHLRCRWSDTMSPPWLCMASFPPLSTMWGWGERMQWVTVSPVQPWEQGLMVSWLVDNSRGCALPVLLPDRLSKRICVTCKWLAVRTHCTQPT